MTPSDLEERLAYWKRVLRLQDWEIHAAIVPKRDLKENDCGGCVEFMHAKKRADIQLLALEDRVTRASWGWGDDDMELTLVHELLHLHVGTFSRPEDESKEWELHEQAIHALSLALIELERKSD